MDSQQYLLYIKIVCIVSIKQAWCVLSSP